MAEIPQYINLYPAKDEEILKNCLYSFAKRFTNIKPEDIEIKIRLFGCGSLSCEMRPSHFDPTEKDFSYHKQYQQEYYVETADQYFNEYKEEENFYTSGMNIRVKYYPTPQINQFNPQIINKDKKFEEANLQYEDFTLFFTIPLEYFNNENMLYFIDLHKHFPSIIKKSFSVLMVDPDNFNELKILGYLTQIKLDNEELYEQFTSIFPILYSKKDNVNLEESFRRVNSDKSYIFITDREGKTKKKIMQRIYDKDKMKVIEKIKKVGEILKPMTKDDFECIEQFIKLKKKRKKIPYANEVDFSLHIVAAISNDFSYIIPKYIDYLSCELELQEKELEPLKKFKNKYYVNQERYKLKVIPTFSLDFSNLTETKCANPSCNTMITKKSGFYYCYWCSIFYCEKCVEDTFKKETENLREKYIHKKHNLLYITTTEQKYLTELGKERLGKNLFARRDDNELSLISHTNCNGCSKGIKNGYRYLCVTCKPGKRIDDYVDYCYDCFDHMRKDDEEGKHIQEIVPQSNPMYSSIVHKNHCHKNHIYLLIITGGNSYLDY